MRPVVSAWDLGDLDAAREAYRQALVLAPDEVTAHYNLALLHEEQGDLAAARSELERVLARQPQDAAREALTRLSQDLPPHTRVTQRRRQQQQLRARRLDSDEEDGEEAEHEGQIDA